MRALPEQVIERDNRLVIVSRFASITDGGVLDILTVGESLEVVPGKG